MTTLSAPSILRRHRFTTSDYHRMGQTGLLPDELRTELLDGEILEMSPINSLHAGTVKRLNRLLSQLFGRKAIISIQDPLALSEYSEPEPDVAILKPRPDFYSTAHPTPADVLFVIEVADSSIYKDRNVKLPHYASAGIPEVWLVDLEAQNIEVYTQPEGQAYQQKQTFRGGDTILLCNGKPVSAKAVLG